MRLTPREGITRKKAPAAPERMRCWRNRPTWSVRAVAEGRARETEAAKAAADRQAERQRRRESFATHTAAIRRQQQLADRVTKAALQRQASRGSAG